MGVSLAKVAGKKWNDQSAPTRDAMAGTTAGTTQARRPPGVGEELAWREVLNAVAEMELWGATKRENRPEWRHFLDKAEAMLGNPRRPLPQDLVASVLAGDLSHTDNKDLPNIANKISVFVSSTFTDTQAERNTLMRDVYPYLRKLCRILGLDFGSVDMRWGVNEEATLSHATASVCVNEVIRCVNESAGPAFLAIIGHKYGYRPFPPEIDHREYTAMRDALVQSGADVSLLDSYFQLDENMIPPHFMLRPRSPDQQDWWEVFEKLQGLLRSAASKCLTGEAAEKYYISVTEQEIQKGVFENRSVESQVTLMRRELVNVRDEVNRHRHIIDMVSGEISEDAQEFLKILKEQKIPKTMHRSDIMDFTYRDNHAEHVKEYVRKSCDAICLSLVRSILKNYEEKLHVEEDPVLNDVLQHRQMAMDKCRLFVGRDDLIGKVKCYINEDTRTPFVVHGNSGCGKTALMAMCARQAKHVKPNAVTIIRFLGTTATSSSAGAMLNGICQHISRVYGKDPCKVPTGYKELIIHFKECLGYATPAKPLAIFMDSLDQLSNEDFGRNLKWLSLRDDLPANVSLVLSTLPGQCLDVLNGFLPDDMFVEIKPLGVSDGSPMLDKMLSAVNRKLTQKQRDIVLKAFKNCPLPLYLRLAVDVAIQWHSYDTIGATELADDMPGLITTLFQRLESKYGSKFVQHALAYITVAKNGLSVTELEDILSCDDDVLNEVFSFWVPPFIRIPPLLWVRVRNELGAYLVERGADGSNTYGWYHRQFWETAERRFVHTGGDTKTGSFEPIARRAIADYFEGKWYEGKAFCNKKGQKSMEDRQIASQPLIVLGNRTSGRKFNRRKISELPHQLLYLEDWTKFKNLVGTLEFIEGKFEVTQGHECVAEFIEASKRSNDKYIMSLSRFIGSGLSHILSEPDSIYQLASQQVCGNPVNTMYRRYDSGDLPRIITNDQNPITVEDPCEMTLQGHTSGLRSCSYSPNGELIASYAVDSLRIWDAFSGAEIVNVPRPDLDPNEVLRPCAFSRDGQNVATGFVDGSVVVWDLAGAQVHHMEGHSSVVTGVAYSPDNGVIASTSNDNTTRFWAVTGGGARSIAAVDMGLQGLACDYSPDGSTLAVACNKGLVLIDVQTHGILSTNSGYCNLNQSARFSPSGHEIATGGDNSGVTLWDGRTGKVKDQLVGHRGWIWCAEYTKDGSRLLSCSSDRTLKMWNMENHQCIVTLGGHLHRVGYVSLNHDESKFVTASLDCSLKVWDFQAVAEGKVPVVGGLHYTVLKVSPDCKYTISSQGWSCNCSVRGVHGDYSAEAAAHRGFIHQVAVSPDSNYMVSMDTGHKGDYPANAVYKAQTIVSSLPGGQYLAQLTVHGPTALACSNTAILVGAANSCIHIFDRNSFKEVKSWSYTDAGSGLGDVDPSIIHITCHPETGHVAIAAGELVKIWDISEESDVTMVSELPSHGQEMKMSVYSPDGAHLITADINGGVRVWNVANEYSFVKNLPGHVSLMRDVAFSPDGRYLATVAVEMSLRIWDVINNFRLLCTWYGPVNQLGFITNNVLNLGEATGNQRRIEFAT